MEKITLVLGLTLTGFGAAAGVFGSVENRIKSIGQALEKAKYDKWLAGADAAGRYGREVEKAESKIKSLQARQERLTELGGAMTKARADLSSRVGDLAVAYGAARALGAPVGAFLKQDEALNALQVTMMDKSGQVAAGYENLRRQAIELGNMLPGTTADFAGTARTLMEQGVAVDAVINGGLKAASYLSVVLRIPSDQAGEMTAKLREAYKLSDTELTKMADAMQRARFAFGMKPSDLMAASSYQAPVLNQLGISGIDNTNKMLAIQGMAAQVGLEGSSFGTNFSMMLSRLAKGPQMLELSSKGMKGHAKDLIDSLGITFDFFDQKGNFKGLDGMVQELEKLNIIRAKLGDKGAMDVAEAMFGAEAGRPAMILAQAGMAGYQAAQQRMAEQASLQQRIQRTTESSKNTIEALTGSLENLGAAVAGPVVQALHPAINLLNDFTGWLTAMAEKHPGVSRLFGVLALGALGAVSSFFALGVAASALRVAWTGMQLVPFLGAGLSQLAVGAGWLARTLGGALLTGLRLAGQAALFLGRSLLMNPIGLIITGIAVSAYLIYRYWEPIKAFFSKLWGGVTSIFSRASAAIKGAIAPVWQGIKNGFLQGIGGVSRLIVNWSPLGLFYKAFSGVLSWFGVDLPKQFTEFGSNLIGGLVEGVKAKFTAAKDAIVGFGQNIKGWFSSVLGIQSPSRVFMGFGDNIGQGLEIGMTRMLPKIQGAAGRLAGAAMAGAQAPDQPAPHTEGMVGNLIGGLVEGVRAKFTAAKDAIVGFGQNIKGWLTNIPPIQMPSRMLMDLGGSIGQMLPNLQGAVGRLAGVVMAGTATLGTPALAADVQAASQALPRAASGVAAGAPGGGGINVTFTPNITIGSDNAAVKNEVQQAMQLSVRELEQMLRRVQAEQQRRAF